jgi:dsDNA-specific endonuclease/ATPase MutS2
MTDQELTEIKSDLREIKEMMRVISKQVAADTEVAAVRTLRKLEESRINQQIRQMSELAD